MIADRNYKEYIQNKANQKKLSQSINSVPTVKLEQNFEQKVLENQKQRVSRGKSINLFPSKTFL